MIRCVGRCLGLAVWTASSESRMCLVPVHEGQTRVGKSRLLTAPPWSPAGGRRVQSSVCGRRAQGLAGRTRRPGVAVAEGSGSSERRRRRVVAAVAARATCIDGLLTGGNEACPSAIHPYLIEIELCGHLWWGRPLSSAKSRRARELILGVSYTTEINFYKGSAWVQWSTFRVDSPTHRCRHRWHPTRHRSNRTLRTLGTNTHTRRRDPCARI